MIQQLSTYDDASDLSEGLCVCTRHCDHGGDGRGDGLRERLPRLQTLTFDCPDRCGVSMHAQPPKDESKHVKLPGGRQAKNKKPSQSPRSNSSSSFFMKPFAARSQSRDDDSAWPRA
jgi:hypothetical protein